MVIEAEARAAALLIVWIARDHSNILERMKAGEFVTVRQAAIASGIMKNPTRLDHFQKLWRNATDEEREAIAVEVQWWFLGCRILLVEKTDRLYRNLKDWVTLDDFDLEIHLVKENIILSNDSRFSEPAKSACNE